MKKMIVLTLTSLMTSTVFAQATQELTATCEGTVIGSSSSESYILETKIKRGFEQPSLLMKKSSTRPDSDDLSAAFILEGTEGTEIANKFSIISTVRGSVVTDESECSKDGTKWQETTTASDEVVKITSLDNNGKAFTGLNVGNELRMTCKTVSSTLESCE